MGRVVNKTRAVDRSSSRKNLLVIDHFPFLRLTGFVEPNLLEPCKGWRAKMENEKWKMTDDQ